MQHTHVDRIMRFLSKGEKRQFQDSIMDHFREKIQGLIPIVISTSFGAADDRNSPTVHIPIPSETIHPGKVLQLSESSHLHITYHPYIDDLLGADLALQVGLALEGRRQPLITAVPERNISCLIQLSSEDIECLPGLQCRPYGIGRSDSRKDLSDHVLALVVSEVFVLVVRRVFADEVVSPQIGDAEHKSHAVLIIFVKGNRRSALELTGKKVRDAGVELVEVLGDGPEFILFVGR